jgi:hypothetical protein
MTNHGHSNIHRHTFRSILEVAALILAIGTLAGAVFAQSAAHAFI